MPPGGLREPRHDPKWPDNKVKIPNSESETRQFIGRGSQYAAWNVCWRLKADMKAPFARITFSADRVDLAYESSDHRTLGFHRRGDGTLGAESGPRGYGARHRAL